MEVKGVPALTRVLEANVSPKERIDLNDEQILELEQQIVCYRGMIRERKKLNKELEKMKNGHSVQRGLMEALIGRGGLGRKAPKKIKIKKRKNTTPVKKKTRKKSKKRSK